MNEIKNIYKRKYHFFYKKICINNINIDMDVVSSSKTEVLETIKNNIYKYIFAFVVFVIFYVGAVIIYSTIKSKIYHTEESQRKKDKILYDFMGSMVYYLVIVVGGIFSLNMLGFNISTLLVILGSLGIAIALAIKTTITQVVSGILILFFNFYDIGDIVEVKGTLGYVREFNLLKTQITDFSGKETIVSNSDFIENHFVNYTKTPTIFHTFDIAISASNDINYNILIQNIIEKIKKESKYCIDKNKIILNVQDISQPGTILRLRVPIKSVNFYYADMELKDIVRNTIADDKVLMLDNSYTSITKNQLHYEYS